MNEKGKPGLTFDVELVGELVGDGLAIVDREGKFTYLSPRGEGIVGMVATEKPITSWVEHFGVFLPDGVTPFAPDALPVAQALRGEYVRDVRMVLRNQAKPKGVFLSVNAAPLRGEDETVNGAVAAFRDITAEENFRTLVERSPDAQLVHKDGLVLYANPRSTELLGYQQSQELVGRPLLDLIHPDDRASVRNVMESPEGERGPVGSEVRCLRSDGTTVLVEGLPQPLVFDGHWAVLFTFRDLTERRRLQQQLLLSERMSSVGTLAAGIAHEINNPLAYIIINLEYIREQLREIHGASPSARARDLIGTLGDVQEGAGRIARIVRGLRTVSRTGDELPELLDLQRIVTVALNMTQSEIRHRAQLVTQFDPSPPVLADESQLVQVFVNLLINAAQALPEGSADEHCITVHTFASPDGSAAVRVQDTGPGVPATILNRIFDPFFTTKPPGVGTGLGLSICHSVISRWGGRIAVDNDPPHGTAFTVTLPPSQGQPMVTSPHRADTAKVAMPSARILVIDDDTNVGKSFERILGRGNEVIVVSSGHEALRTVASQQEFDVVFCDLMMPTMTGEEFFQRLKAKHPRLAERVVFISGALPNSPVRTSESVRDVRCLDKPIEANTLRGLVADALSGRSGDP